jgi:mono/diheme cytochrome c family protein
VGRTFCSVVDVPSLDASAFRRVRPLLPESSYRVPKIQGTQATVGGSGERMPLIGGVLTEQEIASIRAWIAAGGLDN